MSVFSGPEIVNNGLILHYDVMNTKDNLGPNSLKNLASNSYNGFRWFTTGTTVVEGITYNRTDLSYKSNDFIVFDPKPPLPENRNSPTYYNEGGNWFEVDYDVPWGTNDFTWIVWVYFNSFKAGGLINDANAYVLDWKSRNARNTSFTANTGSPSINYRLTTDPFNTISVTSDKTLYYENKWNFMGVRRENGFVEFFNGFEQSSLLSYNTNIEIANNLGIGWGADIDYQWRTLDGSIGPILIYNRALNMQEIQQNFESTRSRYDI